MIEAPIKDITTADTTVSVQSGQTIGLGGMITNEQTVVVRKVPWLRDIPLIGRLFRYNLNRHKRKELLVFLTPVVLEDDAYAESIKARETELIHMPPVAFSFGDNLTGLYSGAADGEPSPQTPILKSSQTSRAPLSKQPEPKSSKMTGPVSRANSESAVGGHSHQIQTTAATTSSEESQGLQRENTSPAGGAVRNASYSSQHDAPPANPQRKKSSRWVRSPNSPGFVSNRDTAPTGKPDITPPDAPSVRLNSPSP